MTHLADGLRAGVRHARRLLLKNWPLLALLALAALLLSPGLATGYWAEDVYHSVVFAGAGRFRGADWFSDTMLSLKISMLVGRFFPMTAFITAFAFYTFHNAMAYKAYIIAVTLLDLSLFVVLVRKLTGRRDFALFAGAVTAALFQFRLGVDPILAYYAQIQWVIASFLLGLILLRSYLDGGRAVWFHLSTLCFLFCTLAYESTYSLVVVPLLLIAQARPGWREGLRLGKPFLLAVLACGFMTALIRWLHPSENYVHKMAFEPGRVLLSIAHQVSAGLPLSYYACDPWGIFGSGRGPIAWMDWVLEPMVLVLCAGIMALGFRTLRRGRRTGAEAMGPVGTPTLVILGLMLAVVPSLMIAISPHHWQYQSFGTGWIQVMIQYFGVGLLLALGAWKLVATRRGGSFAAWKCLGVAGLLAAVVGVTYRANQEVALVLNAPPGSERYLLYVGRHGSSWHMHREHLIAALDAGVMDDVPTNSRLVLAHPYPLWHDSERGQYFYSKHLDRRMETFPSVVPSLLPPTAPLFVVRDEPRDWRSGIVVVTPAPFNPFGVPVPAGRLDRGRIFIRHPAIRPGRASLPDFLVVGHAPVASGVVPATPPTDDQAYHLGTDLPTLRVGPGWGVFALGTTDREVDPSSLRLVSDPVQVAAWRPVADQPTRFAGPGPAPDTLKR